MREIMTPEQVADYLQMNTNTIYRLIRQKKLAATRVGRAYRIPRNDLEDFLLANSTREEVRQGLFQRVLEIAQRNPELDADALLETLENQNQKQATPTKSS